MLSIVFLTVFTTSVVEANLSLSIESTATAPGTTALVSVFAIADANETLSGFNLPIDIGNDGQGLPDGFQLPSEPLQNAIFPNFSFNIRQNDIWDFDGIANADGPELSLSSDDSNPTKLFDIAINVSTSVEIGTRIQFDVVDMLLLNLAPSALTRPVEASAELIIASDCNGDLVVDHQDLTCSCPDSFLSGDLNGNGSVDFADFLVLSGNFGNKANYADGDLDCDGVVGFPDFLTLSANYGKSHANSVVVPEAVSPCWLSVLILLYCLRRP